MTKCVQMEHKPCTVPLTSSYSRQAMDTDKVTVKSPCNNFIQRHFNLYFVNNNNNNNCN